MAREFGEAEAKIALARAVYTSSQCHHFSLQFLHLSSHSKLPCLGLAVLLRPVYEALKVMFEVCLHFDPLPVAALEVCD